MTPSLRPISPNITAVAVVTLLVVTALALGLVGCGGDVTATTTVAPATTATTAATTTTTAAPVMTSVPSTETSTTSESSTTSTTEALSSAETRLPDGTIKGMGFIDRVWEADGVRYLSIDYAEFLTGEEARQAAIEAGYIQPDEDLPNDYFIRNVNTKLREFSVSPSVAITTATRVGGGMDQPATWDEFMSFWSASPPEGTAHLSEMPWWIIRDGGQVIRIDEQYVP